MAQRQLKLVNLLEPKLCLDCRFAEIAEVETDKGRVERMIFCRRGDCDNWVFSSAIALAPGSVRIVGQADPLQSDY